MTVFLIISIIVSLLIIMNLIIYISLRRIKNTEEHSDELPFVSVIIAAKNEAEKISTLILSLSEQNYPHSHFEVIISDDFSSDNTFDVITRIIADKPNFKLMRNSGDPGKRGALTTGIQNASFDTILITDADCRPEKNWIRSLAHKISEGYDLAFGVAPFYRSGGFAGNIACFENFRSALLTFSAAALNVPYSAAARNFAFTKTAFNTVGGYAGTKATVSGDDDLFIREAVRAGLKTGIVSEPGSFVYSETKTSLQEYFNQRARHTQTSFHYLTKHKLILSLWHIVNLLSILLALLFFTDTAFLVPLLIKLTLDVVITEEYQKIFGYKFTYAEIVSLQILYELFLVVHFINAKAGRFKWK